MDGLSWGSLHPSSLSCSNFFGLSVGKRYRFQRFMAPALYRVQLGHACHPVDGRHCSESPIPFNQSVREIII